MEIKKNNFSEWYNSITKDAQLCDLRYGIKGFVVFMPWAVMSMNKMYSIYENELAQTNHMPAWFPALIPESYFSSESDHVEGFVPEVFWVTEAGGNKLEERYAMRPTSETAMYTMYALWIHGLKDLPLKIYQRCQVWRYETKATKPFIRSREFHWIETHNCFATKEDAFNQVREDMKMSEEVIHNRFFVPFIFFRRPQWDKFAGADDTYAADTLMPDGKALQLPSTHMLGQNFSKAFGIKYTDDSSKEQNVWQTCYGPAISRIYAAVIATHGDDKGLILPLELAPIQIVIIPIVKEETKKIVLEKCNEIKKSLPNYLIKIDDSEKTPGFKFNEWEMKGVPIRLELGMRDIDNNCVILVRRDTLEKIKIPINDLSKKLDQIVESINKNLKERADREFNGKISNAEDMKTLGEVIEQGGFIRVPFCSDRLESEACADKIKEFCSANIRGSIFESKEIPNGKCIACDKKATIYLYAARQY